MAEKTIKRYSMIEIAEGTILPERVLDVEECYLIRWPDVGLIIPWPKGTTMKEAADAWKRQLIDMELY